MVNRLIIAVLGFMIGAVVTPLLLAQVAPRPRDVPPSGGSTPDLTISIGQELFIREANRRMAPTLQQYDLRDPQWELSGDNTITLSATSTVPLLEIDVNVRIITQPIVQDDKLAIEIREIEYGRIGVSGDPLSGLADSLNQELVEAINPERFEVISVQTYEDSVDLKLRVVGEL